MQLWIATNDTLGKIVKDTSDWSNLDQLYILHISFLKGVHTNKQNKQTVKYKFVIIFDFYF